MMRAEATYCLAAFILSVFLGVSVDTAAGGADASELTYSPWEKTCIGAGMCIVGMVVRSASECPVASATLIESTVEIKKTLRVGLPKNVRLNDGVRITIDQVPPIRLPFECHEYGCVADYEANAELIDELKHGQTLRLEATRADNSPIRSTLPLAGFAQAYDGPPAKPKLFEAKQGQLQEELDRRARGEKTEARPPPRPRCDDQ
jgi:invasion protein IalB